MRRLLGATQRKVQFAGLLSGAAVLFLGGALQAQTHDLHTDFSTVTNPSSGWGYNRGGLGGTLFESFGSYSSGDFVGFNLGWREEGPDHLGWSQVTTAPSGDPENPVFFTQADTFDLHVGDIITHANTSLTWTADAVTAGVYAIDISAFLIRDLDRVDTLQLWKNDSIALTNAIDVSAAVDPPNSSSAAPLSIASGVIVDLQDGDFLRLLVNGNDYVAISQFTLTPSALPVNRSWILNGAGAWGNSSNWASGLAPDNTSTAVFGSAITAAHTVFTDGAVTTKSVTFDNTNSYVIAGAGSVNLEADAGNSQLNVLQGTHEFQIRVNMNNDADANVAAGAVIEFNNRLNLNGHTLTKTGDGALKINNDLNTGGGSVVLMAGLLGGGGAVGGNLVNSGGSVAPGNSPGTLSVAGAYSQAAAGTLSVELAGLQEGVEYDQLAVAGDATLDGTLAVTLLDGFAPSLGDLFTVLTYASHTGEFGDITGTTLGGHLELRAIYGDTELVLAARPEQDGDINLDGNVDIFDVADVSNNWGTDGPHGDANGDGIVDIFDVALISNNWGAGGGTAAVPEPTSIALVGMGLCGVCLAVRRRSIR